VFTTNAQARALWATGKVSADGSCVSLTPLQFLAASDYGSDLSAASAAIRATMPAPDLASLIAPDLDPVAGAPAEELPLVDWRELFTQPRTPEWLIEPIIPAKRSVALFAPGGTGKSLLALWIATQAATGGTVFGRRLQPIDVLYVDYEMTEDDLVDRLETMGYDLDNVDQLHRLHYALLPSIPGLDEAEGGRIIIDAAAACNAALVVFDTFGRAVRGDENDADTVRAWYTHTGLGLKAAGRAFIRIDHAGKDLAKGQRGTSAKNDDVDVVWQMTGNDSLFKLKAEKRRQGWIPLTVDLELVEQPSLRYELATGASWPDGTEFIADVLDELDVPLTASTRAAAAALKAAGYGKRMDTIRAAVRYRQQRPETLETLVDNAATPETEYRNNARTHPRTHPGPDTPGPAAGPTNRNTPPSGTDPARTHPDPPSESIGGGVRIYDTDPPTTDPGPTQITEQIDTPSPSDREPLI
jgi:hypothetical protein